MMVCLGADEDGCDGEQEEMEEGALMQKTLSQYMNDQGIADDTKSTLVQV
jgi:hypothetical protein